MSASGWRAEDPVRLSHGLVLTQSGSSYGDAPALRPIACFMRQSRRARELGGIIWIPGDAGAPASACTAARRLPPPRTRGSSICRVIGQSVRPSCVAFGGRRDWLPWRRQPVHVAVVSTTSKSWVMVAVLAIIADAEQYFSVDSSTARSTFPGASPRPFTTKCM
jgi:hypothetical protein